MDKISLIFPWTLLIFLRDTLYEVHGLETARTRKPKPISFGRCFFLGHPMWKVLRKHLLFVALSLTYRSLLTFHFAFFRYLTERSGLRALSKEKKAGLSMTEPVWNYSWPHTTSEVEMLMRKGRVSRPKSALWTLLCILTNTRVVFLGIAGLEPATIRLKAQCSTNWAIHPIWQSGLVRKRKEGWKAPFLLIISQGRGSVWGSYCGASLGVLSTHWRFYL